MRLQNTDDRLSDISRACLLTKVRQQTTDKDSLQSDSEAGLNSGVSQKGQIAVILLLFMLIALTIGLVSTQRALTNITTSSQGEQSSRAFSAAEAGLQRSMAFTSPIVNTGPNPQPPPVLESELGNGSNASINVVNNLPRSASELGALTGEGLEYPPISKEETAQFWLANPLNATSIWSLGKPLKNDDFAYGAAGGSTVRIYWGNGSPVASPPPAIEVNLITASPGGTGPGGMQINSTRYFLDDGNNVARVTASNFSTAQLNGGNCSNVGLAAIHTSLSVNSIALDRTFYCYAVINIPSGIVPILIRARILYSNGKEPIAVIPQGNCGDNCSLPRQAAVYTSKGFSGQSQKTLQVFRQPYYLSPLLDFVLFSAAQIQK